MTANNSMFGDPDTGRRIANVISGAFGSGRGRRGRQQQQGNGTGFQQPAPTPAPPPQGGAPAPGPAPTTAPAPAPAAPAYSYDGAVANRVDKIIAADSPLMQRAATRGFQVANRRGLGNSTMAGQAAQLSVLDAATPIATADAQDRLTRDMTADELANRLETTKMNNRTSVETAGIGAGATMGAAQLRADTDLKLAEIANRHDLTMQEKDQLSRIELAKLGFTHETELTDKEIEARQSLASQDIASRYDLAAMDIASRNQLADKDIVAREKLTQMGIDAQGQEAALNRAFQSDQQSRDLASRLDLANMDVASRERVVVSQIEAEAAQRALDRAQQQNLSDKEIEFRKQELDTKLAAAQQERVAAAVIEANSQRMNSYAAINSNPKMKAADRAAQYGSINDQTNQTLNYIQNLYTVKLNPTTPTAAA